jgi:hypothetical protein
LLQDIFLTVAYESEKFLLGHVYQFLQRLKSAAAICRPLD